LLDAFITKKKLRWGAEATKKELENLILTPLTQLIEQEKQSDEAFKNHLETLRKLALNPHHLREFAELVLDGQYLYNEFAVSGSTFHQ